MAQDNLKKIRVTVANKAAELIAEEGIRITIMLKQKPQNA